jgi:hypothetical protein
VLRVGRGFGAAEDLESVRCRSSLKPTPALGAMPPKHNPQRHGASYGHLAGYIRLAVDTENRRAFDIKLPEEVGAHVLLPGADASGKTTSLTRLADGALANRSGVAIVDCKRGGLADQARDLADAYDVPFYSVDADDPTRWDTTFARETQRRLRASSSQHSRTARARRSSRTSRWKLLRAVRGLLAVGHRYRPCATASSHQRPTDCRRQVGGVM